MRKAFFLFALSAAAVAAYFVFRSPSRNFPAISDGTFVGQITGINPGTTESSTLFVERVPFTKSLLIVIFTHGFNPQAVALTRQLDEVRAEGLTSDLPFQPVAFEYQRKQFSLSGRKGRHALSGEVFRGKKRVGEWSLNKITVSAIKGVELASDPGFSNWLTIKAEHRLLADDLGRKKSLFEERQQKLEKLQRFIKEEELLRTRAAERKASLQQEIRTANEERARTIDDVSNLAAELDSFGRIAKEGRAVELARRMSERENKGYIARLHGDESQGSMEEYFGDRLDVDLEKLDVAVLRAQEIRRFEREITEERRLIADLERRIREGSAGNVDRGLSSTPEVPPAEPRSLWDRLFN